MLSKKDLKGQRFFMFLAVFTMMFSGIIPTYIVVKDLHLMNSLWSMILPSAINTYNLIILRNFFMDLPLELEEAALLDGCTEVGVLFRIMLPISKPALTTVTLFYAVDHWNDFFFGDHVYQQQTGVAAAAVPAFHAVSRTMQRIPAEARACSCWGSR